MGKNITVNVPHWVSEEEVRLWVAEGIGRKMAKKIILDALAEGLELTEEEKRLFDIARERAWRKTLERYRREGLVE